MKQALLAGEVRLRTARTAEWLRDTAERAQRMLEAALPPLCSHPRPAVRQALADGACSYHLGRALPMCLYELTATCKQFGQQPW